MAVADSTEPGSTEQQLAWEARQRPRAALAAILGGLLTLGANIWISLAFRDAPRAGFLESLQNLERPGQIGGAPSVRLPEDQFLDDHVVTVIASAVVLALGLFALGWAVTFLAAATRARRLEFPRWALYLPLIGGVLEGVAAVIQRIASASTVSDFLSGPHTVDAAVNAASDSLSIATAIIGLVGQLALTAGLVLVCLNAMRAGLLTRSMGLVGVVVGVLQIIPLQPVQPVVQTFWLFALGALLLGLGRGGMPPAWKTGRAEPWPSQAELAEQRRAARGDGTPQRQGKPQPQAQAPAAPKRPAPVAGSAKRKRKRRR